MPSLSKNSYLWLISLFLQQSGPFLLVPSSTQHQQLSFRALGGCLASRLACAGGSPVSPAVIHSPHGQEGDGFTCSSDHVISFFKISQWLLTVFVLMLRSLSLMHRVPQFLTLPLSPGLPVCFLLGHGRLSERDTRFSVSLVLWAPTHPCIRHPAYLCLTSLSHPYTKC